MLFVRQRCAKRVRASGAKDVGSDEGRRAWTYAVARHAGNHERDNAGGQQH